MKNIAFIYSGDGTGLNSLEYNRDGVAEKLQDFGDWEIAVNKKLDSELTFIEDIEKYQNDEIDNILIYYTGHGVISQPSKTFELKISDKQGISPTTLYSKIFQCFSKGDNVLPLKLAIVLDACYSGKAIDETEQFGTSEILASSLAGKQSFEVGFPKNKNGNVVKSKMSLFSHYFCEAIESLQSELETIHLSDIRHHINTFVKIQIISYSLKIIYDKNPMTIANGNLREEYLADVETIYLHVYPKNSQYEILVNHEYIMSVEYDKFATVDTQKKIIDKINTLLNPIIGTRIELFLPKELYAKTLPLWRESIVPNCETVIRSQYKESMSQNWLPALKKRWKGSFDSCKNMSFLHEDVTTKVENETMRDSKRISVLVEKKVTDVKVFDGIDQHYYIGLWINSCDKEAKYKDFIDSVAKSKLCNLPREVRTQIVNHTKYCTSNICLMWDDPHKLPIRENNYE